MEVGNDSFYSGCFVTARDGTYHFTGDWAADSVLNREAAKATRLHGCTMYLYTGSIQITNVYLNQLIKVTQSQAIFILCYLGSLFYFLHISFAISDLIVANQKEKEHL